ncbi:MAG: CHAT domain-containing protein, partial [candidate division KSB1 bacterium]|nr:CHAT domain-containing protein [candidate division KSB1 bacterium]
MPIILDFQITPAAKDQFQLELKERGKTQSLAKTTFDYDLSFLTDFEISGLDFDPKDPAARMERLKTFGGKLYKKLFSPEIETIWQRYQETSDFLILCLRISPDKATVGLEAIPWETLFDGDEFLAAGAKTGLSRLPLDIKPQDDCAPIAPPLKMLAFIASPLDLAENERLQIEREQEMVLQAVNAPAGQGKLVVDFEDEAKLTVLETSWETDYHIFHYTGHGIAPESGGGLLLEDANGNKRPTSVAEVLSAMQKAEKSLRLAVISGCQTARTLHVAGFRDLARALIRKKIPSVIAMQFSISDAAGLLFAETLYPKLIAGQSLELALSATRRELLHHDDFIIKADAFAPVLFTSNGECLKLTEPKATATAEIKIDYSFFLPLPQLSFGFYGRRKEYRQIRDGLLHQNHRAVIVHGIGGIGKTALASHIATRLKRHFQGVYAFDCASGALAPERILLELHRYFERQGIKVLEPLVHAMLPPDQSATYLAQLLSQFSLLLIFDNFETQLLSNADFGFRNAELEQRGAKGVGRSAHNEEPDANKTSLITENCLLTTEPSRLPIADPNLRIFLNTLVKATREKTRFIFTCRYLFELDEKRVGTVQELTLGDLSRPEALGLMQKLPHLSNSSYEEKLQAFEVFGGHPYALIALDRHCGFRKLADILQDASAVHAELRRFIAIELNYRRLSERARELLDRLAAFRVPVPVEAAEWVVGTPVRLSELSELSKLSEVFGKLDRNELPEELRDISEADLLKMFEEFMPEKRVAKNLDQPLAELIAWGLLTPIMDDGNLQALSVHSLVRDFCRDLVCASGEENWRRRLRDAAKFYTNQTRLIPQDEKTPAVVWSEMEAFELLFEANEYEDASNLLMELDPHLDRWGFGRYLESQYRRLLNRADKKLRSKIEHNIGVLLQSRGDYGSALAFYQRSLKMLEELGDRAGVSRSLHQIGLIHQYRGDYGTALAFYQRSLKMLEEL